MTHDDFQAALKPARVISILKKLTRVPLTSVTNNLSHFLLFCLKILKCTINNQLSLYFTAKILPSLASKRHISQKPFLLSSQRSSILLEHLIYHHPSSSSIFQQCLKLSTQLNCLIHPHES